MSHSLTYCLRVLTVLCTLWMALLPAPTAAQDEVRVEARVNATTVGADDVLTYTLTVRGAPLSSVQMPAAPGTRGLSALQSMPNTRREVVYRQGALQQSVSFAWEYRPLREGTARIEPVEVEVQGETHATAAIDVRVVPQSQRARRRTGARAQRPSASGGGADGEAEERNDGFAEDDLFIRTSVSKRRLYLGEQSVITYRLFFRRGINLRHSRLAGAWDAAGFWREELDVSSRPVPRSSLEDGERYQSIVLKRVAVFPTRTGTLTIDPLRIDTEAERSRRAYGSSRFFSLRGRSEELRIASDSVTIEVQPLPGGAPSSFGGAVGTFEMEARTPRPDVAAGDPVEVAVRVTGRGNIATLEAPAVTVPSSFERYDPSARMSVARGGDFVRGTKTFTYTFVPRESGSFQIDPVPFSYFDPEAEQYETLRTDAVTLRVRGGAEAPPAAAGQLGSGLPANDIAGVLPAAARWVRTAEAPLYKQPWAYAVLLVPLALLAGLLAVRRRTDRRAEEAARRQRAARPHAEEHLAEAERALDRDRPRAAYEHVERALLGFIGHRLGIAAHGLTRAQLGARLAEAGVPDETRQTLDALLEACDRARFAPAAPIAGGAPQALAHARTLLDALDDALAA